MTLTRQDWNGFVHQLVLLNFSGDKIENKTKKQYLLVLRYHVTGMVLSVFRMLSHLILRTTLWGMCFYSYFSDEETEAQ